MRIKRTICWLPDQCREAERFLLKTWMIASDVETIPYRKKNKHDLFVMTVNSYTGIDFNGSIQSFGFPFQQSKSPLSGAPTYIEDIYNTCVRINASGIPFTGHNFVYDLAWYLRYGMPVANWSYDSMIMFWSKWPELPKTLDFVSSILLDHYQYWKAGRKADDYIEYMNYGMSDTESTLLNTILLIQMMLEDDKMRKNFFRAFTRCLIGLSMSVKGMRVNEEKMAEFEVDLEAEAEKALSRVRYLVADSEFNPNSPKQKHYLIYGLMGAKKRNAKGKFVQRDSDASTGAVPLRSMRNDHPIFRRVANGILEAIEPAKQLSNVVGLKFLKSERHEAPRFYTAYDGVGTTTTRLSSRASAYGHGGNAQNIRKDYRPFAESDPDSVFLEVDFSASDDYYVAFESQEQKKIELCRSGKDIHATNALIFFTNWNYESIIEGKNAKDPKIVHPITGIRQITKKLVHGNHYLMAGLTLLMTAGREAIVAAAKEVGYGDAGLWPQNKLVKFCEGLETLFRNHYPRFKRGGADSWYTELRKEVIETGGFTTVFNYFQRFLGDPYDEATLRAVAASAGQANTAGRVNMALDELVLGIRQPGFRDGDVHDPGEPLMVTESIHGTSIRQQTHDSIGANLKLNHPGWREGVDRILRVMHRPVLCKGEVFSVGVEAEVSYRWGGKESIVIRSADDIEAWVKKFPRSELKRFDEEQKEKARAKLKLSAA